MTRAFRPLLFLLLAFTVACHSRNPQERYPFHGVVISTDMRAHQALIKHEDVPGLMKGMTMPFNIHDEKVLAALKPGDIIQATLVKEEYEAWLEDLKVTGSDPAYADKPATSSVPHRPTPGEAVPDFTFTNQTGKLVRFSELRGAPVLLTFIYARCPLPDFCPRMNANLLAIAQQAAKETKDPHLQLLSISFDPEHDTPDMLKNYARQWTDDLPPAQRARWQFVVPPKSELKIFSSSSRCKPIPIKAGFRTLSARRWWARMEKLSTGTGAISGRPRLSSKTYPLLWLLPPPSQARNRSVSWRSSLAETTNVVAPPAPALSGNPSTKRVNNLRLFVILRAVSCRARPSVTYSHRRPVATLKGRSTPERGPASTYGEILFKTQNPLCRR